MTDPNYTHIAVVLDRSGSMHSIKADTEGGFATFLAEQKAAPGRATISLAQFDDNYEVVYGPQDIASAPPLKLVPRGSTALLDAMGKTIVSTGEFLESLPEAQRPGNVIFVVITDGQENASREWTRDKVFAKVTEQQNTYGWTFVFLAANQDAIASGRHLGFAAAQSLSYTDQTVGSTYSTLSASVTRSRVGQNAAFTKAERDAAAGQQ